MVGVSDAADRPDEAPHGTGPLPSDLTDDQLAAAFPDKDAREAEIRRRAEIWAKEFDGNSLVVLRRASIRFDAEKDLGKVKARVLYVLSRVSGVPFEKCMSATLPFLVPLILVLLLVTFVPALSMFLPTLIYR